MREGPYRIFFYSDEGTEPPHVQVEAAERPAKFWLAPLELTWNAGFRSGEIKEIEGIFTSFQQYLLGEWNDYFGL